MSSPQGGYASFAFDVHVTPVNDPPSILGPKGHFFVGKEDSKISLAAGGGIVLNDPDELDATGQFMEVRISVEAGTLRLPLSRAAGLYLLSGEQPSGSPEFSARGGLVDLNRALQGLVYHSPEEWSGVDHMDMWVSDLGDRAGGDALESLASFVVKVEAVPDAPKLIFPKIVHYLDEDAMLAINFVGVLDEDSGSVLTMEGQPEYGVIDILEADLQQDVLRNVELSRNSSLDVHGKEVGGLTLRGTAEDVDAAIQMLTYIPSTNFAGQVTLSLRVTDDTGLTANGDTYLYVRSINDPPVVELPGESDGSSTLKITAGGAGDAILGITITDVDAADNSAVCANMQLEGRNALSLMLTPFSGSVSIVADRAVGVRVVNAPMAGPREQLILQGSVASLQAALDGGLVLYSAPANFSGRDTINVDVDDGGNCGSGGAGSISRTLAIDVAPYDPPLVVTFDTDISAGSVVFTREGEPLILPDVVVTGGSVGEQAAVEVVLLAVSGNVTLQQTNLGNSEILEGTEKTGERLRVRGSPAALTAALAGVSFQPRPYYFGCWNRNGSCTDDTPVRSSRVQGALALASVNIVGTPDGAGGNVFSDEIGVKLEPSWSMDSLRISVGWLNDPPTVEAPETIAVAFESLKSPVPGIRVADPDVMDASEERGRLEVNVSTSMGGALAVDAMIALRNGLRDIALDEHQVRLRGRPEYVNNVLTTLTISQHNSTNGTTYTSGELIDEIIVEVSDLGFCGGGGEQRTNALISVEAGLSTSYSSLEYDVFALEKSLLLVSTKEGSAVAVPGLGEVFSGASGTEELTVIVSANEGYLSLGPHSDGVAVAAAKEDWGPAVTQIKTVGGAEQTLPEVQVSP